MLRILVLLTVVSTIDCRRIDYEGLVKFTVFNNATGKSAISTLNRNFSDYECEPSGKYAVIVHGWKESIKTPWVSDLVRKLLIHRGGCVIFMDYSYFSIVTDYFRLTPHFNNLAELLFRKLKQIGNYDRMFMFGFSFGSRLCFEAGARLGNNVIDRIDACDPAGPGFDGHRRTVDPKFSAKNVACINTSTDKGTSNYNCHQNFRMGKCGASQLAVGPRPFGNHGLCPYFYNAAFNYDFAANNIYGCSSSRAAANVTNKVLMGYRNTISTPLVYGDVFVPTFLNFPWNSPSNDVSINLLW